PPSLRLRQSRVGGRTSSAALRAGRSFLTPTLAAPSSVPGWWSDFLSCAAGGTLVPHAHPRCAFVSPGLVVGLPQLRCGRDARSSRPPSLRLRQSRVGGRTSSAALRAGRSFLTPTLAAPSSVPGWWSDFLSCAAGGTLVPHAHPRCAF